MQREEKAVILLVSIVFFLFIGTIGFSVVQCSNIGKTAAEHERNILNICQAGPVSDYTNCLRREWDRVHDIPEYAKKER